MSKSSQQQIFESIIATSIKKLQQYYTQSNKAELDQFKQRLALLDKGVKELDANPYFFLFLYMISTKSQMLIQEALKNIQTLLSEHFLTPYKSKQLWQNLVSLLRKTISIKPKETSQIISLLSQPNIETFQLIFDVLQYTQSDKVQSSCINLLGRVFQFKYFYPEEFHRKIAVLFEPSKKVQYGYQLITDIQQNQLLTYYVKKIVVDMVDRIQVLEGQAIKGTGKFGQCFMCRQLADHYCKDTKVPVCGSNCKKAHMQQLQKVSIGTVHYPVSDKQQIQKLLYTKLSASQNSNIRSFILWCLIKILSISEFSLTETLKIQQLVTDTLDFKKNLLHFYFLFSQRQNSLCENMFHSIYLYSQNIEYKFLLQNYFAELLCDKRIFQIFQNFDMQQDRISIVKQILQHSSKTNKKMSIILIQQLLNNVLNNHPEITLNQQTVIQFDKRNRLVTVFNTQKDTFQAETQSKTPKQKAALIFKYQKYLNKQKMATYLTKQKNNEILKQYIQLLNILKLELQQSIRQLFFHISPRQSQQIYRLLAEFCKIYKSQKIKNEETLFLFSYLIIMLQTELHNPVVQKRTTYDQMVKRVSEFSKQLSEDSQYMVSIYRNIQSRPFTQLYKIVRFSSLSPSLKRQYIQYHPCLIIYENWQTIYSLVSTDLSSKSMQLAYKTSVFLINFDVAQQFIHLLIKQLYQRPFTDPIIGLLCKWVFDLIFREPNYVQKQWAKVFHFFYRYQNLRQNVQNGTRPDLINQLQIAQSIIPDQIILKTFQISQILSDEEIIYMCDGIATVPLIYFLHLVPMLIQINFKRLPVFWKSLSSFIGMQSNYILKTTCFAQIIGLVYASQSPDQDHINIVIKDSLTLLYWLPQKQSLFLQFIINIINSCGKLFTNEVWQLIFQSLHKLSIKNRIVLCSLLKQICPIYVNFIRDDSLKNQSIEFLEANRKTIQSNQQVFEPCISQYKQQDSIRFFLSDAFRQFVIQNVDSLPASKQLYSVLTKTQITQQNLPKVQKFLQNNLNNIKQIQGQCINFIVHMMATDNKQKGYELFQKLIESNKIQMSQYEKDFKNNDQQSKPSSKDYDSLVKKTLNQVTIINSLSQELLNINNDILQKVLVHIEQLILFSTAFNRNIPLRHYLWKNGLVKSLKQLPGLLKTQRNSQMVRFGIWNKIGQKDNFNKIVVRWNELTTRLVSILKQYRQKESSVQDQMKIHIFNEIQRQITDYRKLLPKLLSYQNNINWQSIQKENKVNWLNCFNQSLVNGLFKFKQQVINQGVNADQVLFGKIFEKVVSTL